MITLEDVARGRLSVENLFTNHALAGPATVLGELEPSVAAAGQHLGGHSPQRGLHGTAAAIRVLAESASDASQERVRSLVQYATTMREVEASLGEDRGLPPGRVAMAEENVIKKAELLYALGFVPPATARREDLVIRTASELRAGRLPQGGWGYLTDSSTTGTPLPLPTAHAVVGLSKHRFDVRIELDWLRSYLRVSGAPDPKSASDVSVRVFVLYVLCFVDEDWERHKKELNKWFEELWSALSPLLSWDLEANIEYEFHGSVEYVRVPWQLHLIACAARLRPYKRFAGVACQKRLKSILDQIDGGGGVIYPHSGEVASTRTNAIVYEMLGRIRVELDKRRLPLGPFEFIDKGSAALKSKAALVVLRTLAVLLTGAAVLLWALRDAHPTETLGANLAASLLLLIFASQRGSR